MKILVVDRFLKNRLHSDWKEGWGFYYAGIDLGLEIDIAGLDCPISEENIPDIANNYDLIILSENYPLAHQDDGTTWKWWDWKNIKTPKLFWAIDTHLINYQEFILKNKFDFVGLNNHSDLKKYGRKKLFFKNPKVFHLPLAIRKDLYEKDFSLKKEYDITFIGSLLTESRRNIVKELDIKVIKAFGENYIKEMQSSRICFNETISYDLNNKFFEITGSGSFMLSNSPSDIIYKLFDIDVFKNCIWKNEEDLKQKVSFYLHHHEIRESIAKALREYTLSNHTFNNRINLILENIR